MNLPKTLTTLIASTIKKVKSTDRVSSRDFNGIKIVQQLADKVFIASSLLAPCDFTIEHIHPSHTYCHKI
ncbi:MAG: hypothetical protein ACTHK8_05650 [Ginsengibacter sp.]